MMPSSSALFRDGAASGWQLCFAFWSWLYAVDGSLRETRGNFLHSRLFHSLSQVWNPQCFCHMLKAVADTSLQCPRLKGQVVADTMFWHYVLTYFWTSTSRKGTFFYIPKIRQVIMKSLKRPGGQHQSVVFLLNKVSLSGWRRRRGCVAAAAILILCNNCQACCRLPPRLSRLRLLELCPADLRRQPRCL